MPMASRREFLTGASTLVLGVALGRSAAARVVRPDAALDGAFQPNAFVSIAADDTVTVFVKHIEFGQGTYTGLSTLVAEELDADWGQMRATAAPADDARYANTLFGMQGTGGSTAMANSYLQMRKAGAAARQLLVQAAAETWGVPATEISVAKGQVAHAASGRRSGFGALAATAAGFEAPTEPRLKDPKDFSLIGTDLPKLDSRAKATGAAVYPLDVYRDGMLTVAVAHPPAFGARVASVDGSAAKAVAGVRMVREIPQGVAVYADNTYAAFKGRDALEIEWDTSDAETRSTEELTRVWLAAARKGGLVAEATGDVEAALAGAAVTLEAEYVFPYLAHASMEPIDGVIEVRDGKAEAWLGAQTPTVDQRAIAQTLGLAPDAVEVHVMLTGGSFGRRAQPTSEVATEVAAIAKAAGRDGAFKLAWSRADDMRGGFYRPLTAHRLRGGLDAAGNIVAWANDVANQSIVRGSPFEGMIRNGLDSTSYEGSTGMPYAWPAHRVTWAEMRSKTPPLWWRSVGHTHTAYATETFLDELLERGGKDRVEGRLDLIKESPRDAAVLRRVADMAGWSGPDAGNGRARGVALHESFNTYVAMIAEVSAEGGEPKTHKVWCAVDCGLAVNPNVIRAQIEGGLGYGLGAALFNEITLEDGGRVRQANFDSYRPLRIDEMPEVEVSILQSEAPPTGVGEPGTPPIAPAVANAWRALTGATPRRLPMVADGV